MSSGPGGCWEIGLERVGSRSLVCFGRRGPKGNVVGDAGPEKANERRCEAGDALWMLALHNGHVQRWASVGVGGQGEGRG